MSAVALPRPRAIRLPRVRFKKPRWPKGDRVWLTLCVANGATIVMDVLAGYWDLFGVPFAVAACAGSGWAWWRSRRDDNGPSAT